MNREDIKNYIKSKPWNRLLSDYDLNNKVEEYAEFFNYAQKQVKNIAYEPVLGVVNKYEIDFGNHCRAGIDIQDNKPIVIGAMNGWGDGISLDEIKIKDLNNA